jgi:peptidyl-tRNA hydrolase, PTH1 family
VLGLGNPGPEHAASRHNIGFAVVDRLARRWCIALVPVPGMLIGRGRVCGVQTVLAQPRTFMNRSGEALVALGEAWDGRNMVVVHDDMDLPVGRLRIRHDGGAGGHRGVSSIIEHVGTAFDRLKVGVGRPTVGASATEHVLVPMTAEELNEWGSVIERANDALECWLAHGVERAMNRYNTRHGG